MSTPMTQDENEGSEKRLARIVGTANTDGPAREYRTSEGVTWTPGERVWNAAERMWGTFVEAWDDTPDLLQVLVQLDTGEAYYTWAAEDCWHDRPCDSDIGRPDSIRGHSYRVDPETGRGSWVDATTRERQELCEARAELAEARDEIAELREWLLDLRVANAAMQETCERYGFIAERALEVKRNADGSLSVAFTLGSLYYERGGETLDEAVDEARATVREG